MFHDQILLFKKDQINNLFPFIRKFMLLTHFIKKKISKMETFFF